jgi:hypothetical protein
MNVMKMNFTYAPGDLRRDLAALYPKGARAIDLVRHGHQTTVTSSCALGEVGDFVELVNTREEGVPPVLVKVTAVRQIRPPYKFARWSATEGLSKAYLKAHPALRRQIQTAIVPLPVRVVAR